MGLTHVLKRLEMAVGVVCLGVMFLVICTNVIMRYLMTAPLFWAEEVSNFMFVWAGFLSCAYVLADDQHIRVTLFVGMLKPLARLWVSLVMAIILLIVFASFVWPCLHALGSLNVTASLQIPETFPYAILPISMVLCFTHSAIRIVAIGKAIVAMQREVAS
jgi:TRAP-type C4-dicarboxylate transport system permease small subunit